jgi:hypothetical protein
VLGYTNQFLTHSLTDEWEFGKFWPAIFVVWESECVSNVRRTHTAEHWHQIALSIQKRMEELRAEDSLTDEREAGRYWDGFDSEGVSEYGFQLAKAVTSTSEKIRIRAEYDGIRALLELWSAQREQGRESEPSMDVALMLFHAIMVAVGGDDLLERARRQELTGLQDLDAARHDYEVYLHGRRELLVSEGYLSAREHPAIDARLTALELIKKREGQRAEEAVAAERRQRSSKGGAAVAKIYNEKRDRLIEQFKVSSGKYKSLAAAATALAPGVGVTVRTAEQYLRRFVSENPQFRPTRSS